MTTKPEGPAPERQNVGGDTKCKNCEQPKSAHWASSHIYCPISLGRACWYEPVDAATPAPSQPAGVREFYRDVYKRTPTSHEGYLQFAEAYARQQTAAKDAEIERLTLERDAALLGQRRRQEHFQKMGDLADEAIALKEAAEADLATKDAEAKYYREQMASAHDGIEYLQRERDSLREALRFCREVGTALSLDSLDTAISIITNVRERAERELSAPKAGKE